MAGIYDVAAAFRRDLDKLEGHAVWSMAGAYEDVASATRTRVEGITDAIAARRAAGKDVPVSWLFTEQRLGDLIRDTGQAFDSWATSSAPKIRAAVDGATSIGPTVAMEMIRAQIPRIPPEVGSSLVRMRQDEIEQIVAAVQPGPLRDLIRTAARERADTVERKLIEGVAASRDPRVVAKEIAADIDGGLSRARRIVRTEMMRSTREAQRLAYLGKSKIVTGWTWFSTLDRRTCPVCWAMHGVRFNLDEPFGGHPNCRCSMVPIVEPPPDLGLEGAPPILTGEARFAKLPEEDQLRILGPRRFSAYKNGTGLRGMVGRKNDPEWGPTHFLRPLGARSAVAPRPTPPAPSSPPTAAPPPTSPDFASGDSNLPESIRDRLDIFTAQRGTKKTVRDAIDHGMKRVDQVLRVPQGMDGMIDVRYTTGSRGRVGAYHKLTFRSSGEHAGSYIEIGGNSVIGARGARQGATTFVHEFGHYVDYETLGAETREGLRKARSAAQEAADEFREAGLIPGEFLADPRSPLAEWYAAANQQSFRDRIASAYPPRTHYTGSDPYLYFLSPTEMFARSFEMFIAHRSGDAELLSAIRASSEELGYRTDVYWTEEEWQPIEAALERFFEGKGMLR